MFFQYTVAFTSLRIQTYYANFNYNTWKLVNYFNYFTILHAQTIHVKCIFIFSPGTTNFFLFWIIYMHICMLFIVKIRVGNNIVHGISIETGRTLDFRVRTCCDLIYISSSRRFRRNVNWNRNPVSPVLIHHNFLPLILVWL